MIEKANLFIVGAAKSGTSSLYNYVNIHPEIFMSNIKEPHYFAVNFVDIGGSTTKIKDTKYIHRKVVNNLDEYTSLFSSAYNYKFRGEASPSYLWAPTAAQKIFSYNPNSKIIILLRDPIQRAFSHYLMDLKSGSQLNSSFYKALINDKKCLPKIWGKAHLYMELGLYSKSVKSYIDLFGKENVKIILFDDLKICTDFVLEQLFNFLEVNSDLSQIKINSKVVYNKFEGLNSAKLYSIKNYLINKNILNKVPFKGAILKMVSNVVRKNSQNINIDKKAVSYLSEIYKSDLILLQDFLDIDISPLFSTIHAK